MARNIPRILLADDDEELCEELAEILREEGYEVETVFAGARAGERAADDAHDLYLLDMKMPGLSGLDILTSLKRRRPDAKVVIVTGSLAADRFLRREKFAEKTEHEDVLRTADAVIAKPFDIDVVLAAIARLTGRRDRA